MTFALSTACVIMSTSSSCRCKRGEVARTETDVIREQQTLKQTQIGGSWVWTYETSACHRCYHTRPVGASEYGATCGMLGSCRRDEGSKTSEAQKKHTYVCIEEESSSDLGTVKRAVGAGQLT